MELKTRLQFINELQKLTKFSFEEIENLVSFLDCARINIRLFAALLGCEARYYKHGKIEHWYVEISEKTFIISEFGILYDLKESFIYELQDNLCENSENYLKENLEDIVKHDRELIQCLLEKQSKTFPDYYNIVKFSLKYKNI